MTKRQKPNRGAPAVEALLDALAERLRADPALAERTMAMLSGELACSELEDSTVRDEIPTSVRLPADLVKRLDALIPRLARVPMLAALGSVTRSKLIRLALTRGVGLLESEHPIQTERNSTAKGGHNE